MVAANIEIVLVGIAIVNHAGFEVVATWWSEVGIWSGDSEGEGYIHKGEKGKEYESHCQCLCLGV